ncbi:hypothetical protein [Natrinema limicola]|uniref:hypothetical protein n=1 Tax=Natrinema limicola TaxID=370323 RepID=UPI001F4C762E|nr:hypothetical protein [Natrinema limicola]
MLVSNDGGKTWTTAATLPNVRHIHAVQTDPYTDDIWITTGDRDEECLIGRLQDGTIEIVGSGDQSWRAVELAFTPTAVLWGVDSVYTEQKPIRALSRAQFDTVDPEPETVHEVSSSVYYAETIAVDGEQWVLFSTAMESGTDGTGPDTQTVHSDGATVVAASSSSEFTDWYELATYRKRTTPADRWNPRGYVPTANAYVFLASDPERGVFINPYNTDRDDGIVRPVPTRAFAAHS